MKMENGIEDNFTVAVADNCKYSYFQVGCQTSFIESQNN